jgi:Holliday junction resolvase RusA-like endonuclease
MVPRGKPPYVHRYVTKEAIEYKDNVRAKAIAAGWTPIPKPAEIHVYFIWRRTERRGDLDNKLKVILDALQKVAYENDSQIVGITAAVVMDSVDDVEVGIVVETDEQISLEEA